MSAMASSELVSDVLEKIFLLLASPADLVRASAVRVSFRRLVTSASFLRRYRSVHPPLLLGFVNRDGFHPVDVEAAHRSEAAAVTRSLEFYFLPQIWFTYDVRDGRVLVGRSYWRFENTEQRRRLGKYWDIGVCDPLFRQFLPLPSITDDLLASVGLRNQDIDYSGACLTPASGGGMEEETSFGVMCWMFSNTRLVVFIFSTATSSANWAAVKSVTWADLGLSEEFDDVGYISGQCVYGCFYWQVYRGNKLIKLDMDAMEFSMYDLPPDHEARTIAIVESGEGNGEVVMFSTHGQASVEHYALMQNCTDDRSHKWHLKGTIPLPAHGPNIFDITGQAEGYVFLKNFISEEHGTKYLGYFSLDVKSCNIERACRISGSIDSWPYFGFPKSISQRRIQGHEELPKF